MIRFLLILLFPTQIWAWGGRGHSAICEAASFLVKEKALKEYLQFRSHIMGHVCNIPDTHWRNLGSEVNKIGGPTHYIDPEVLGTPIKEIPLVEYQKLTIDFQGKDNPAKLGAKIYSLHDDFGSLWWRVDEFFRRISKLDFKNSPPPEKKQEQDEKLPYNQNVYDMTVYMGLLGHYIGDASQPLHNTVDYDGYQSGHGGLHGYYETEVASQFGPELAQEIFKKAQTIKNAPYLTAKTPLEKMKAFSVISAQDLPKLWKLDPVTKKSEVKKEKGMEIKVSAERKSASEGFKAFRPLMIDQMSRSAVLLAQLWDEAYRAAGSPDLTKYRSYKYPFTPDFVRPDYLPADAPKK